MSIAFSHQITCLQDSPVIQDEHHVATDDCKEHHVQV